MMQELQPPVRDQARFLKGAIKITTSTKSYGGWLDRDHYTHRDTHTLYTLLSQLACNTRKQRSAVAP